MTKEVQELLDAADRLAMAVAAVELSQGTDDKSEALDETAPSVEAVERFLSLPTLIDRGPKSSREKEAFQNALQTWVGDSTPQETLKCRTTVKDRLHLWAYPPAVLELGALLPKDGQGNSDDRFVYKGYFVLNWLQTLIYDWLKMADYIAIMGWVEYRISEASYTDYDPGLLNNYGGGNVDWWLDYVRTLLVAANEHWRSQLSESPQPNRPPGREGGQL